MPANNGLLSSSPTVYVVQDDPKKNYTSALDFGRVEGVLAAREEATMLNVPQIVTKIRYALRNMTSQDYLVLIGNPISIGIAFAVAAEVTGGMFNVLKWDQQEKRYFVAAINLHPEV